MPDVNKGLTVLRRSNAASRNQMAGGNCIRICIAWVEEVSAALSRLGTRHATGVLRCLSQDPGIR